ncbi:MAG: ABC transporter ATP-binding protein [Streptosporangiaceae bacterium]
MNDTTSGSLLQVTGLTVTYGAAVAVSGLSLSVSPGQVVYLIGRNGAGKTSAMRGIMGLERPATGSVLFLGQELTRLRPDQIVRKGIAFVMSGRRAIGSLSVKENLLLADSWARRQRRSGMRLDEVLTLFPQLDTVMDRSAAVVSGGEQQMLKIARALLSQAKLLLLDEPTEGLAPAIVKELARAVQQLATTDRGILIAEQRRDFLEAVPGTVYEMERGTAEQS